MRHGKKFNKLSRTHAHRRQMLSNMAASLIMHKKIKTTLAKAKALRVYVEPLLTKSKDDTTNSRRVVFSYLMDKNAVTELFREIAPKIANRQGGYTRILKTGYRLGDNAEMALIELVDYNENMLSDGKGKAKTRRSRGSKKTSSVEGASSAAKAAEVEEAAPVSDVPAAADTASITAAEEAAAKEAAIEEKPEAISDAEIVEETK
ncbi:MAG: 50S ribosomal protein L17 [Bacteroidales bacterium]|jgi:large subunit ribosomal protein L17|nr:50S ribosomal protein L17 [Bacteroidales bacterium]